jgi:hypothetical protein
MAARSGRRREPGPAPPARSMTVVELIDHATDDPAKALLLILVVCCPIIAASPAVILIVLAAMKLSSLKLMSIALVSTFGSSSALAFVIIKVKKMRKSLKNRGPTGGELTK